MFLNFVGTSSPIIGSLLSQDIALGIEQALGLNGLFGKVFRALDQAALNIVNVVGGAVQSVFTGVTSLASLIQQKGLAPALESIKTSFFNRSSQEALLAKGGIQNVLNTTPKVAVTLSNGQTVQEMKLNETNSLYFDVSGNIVGKKEDGMTQIGTFGINSSGKVAINDGQVFGSIFYSTAPTDLPAQIYIDASIKRGQAMTFKVDEGPQQTRILDVGQAESLPQNTPILFQVSQDTQATPSLWASLINVAPLAISFAMNEGVAYAAQIDGGATSQSASTNSTTLFALVNGILNNEPDPAKYPDYINNFESDIAGSSNGQYVVSRDFMKSSIYQGLMMNFNPLINSIENQAKDILNLFFEAISPITHFVSTVKIMMDFDNRFRLVPGDKTRPIVAMGYSGGFLPLIEAIEARHYNTDTLIGLGAATTAPLNVPFEDITKILDYILFGQMGDAITTLSKYLTGIKDISLLGIKRVVNVWGTKDILSQMGIAGKRSSIGGTLTYNIEIAGASHFDYMRRSGETDPVKAAFNLKVSSFIATLTTKADDDQKLLAFLQEKLVAPDSDGVWRYRP